MNDCLPLLLAAWIGVPAAAQDRPAQDVPPPVLTPAGAISMPDVQGRIDHLAVDLGRERLYVAALGNDSVEVLDLAAREHLRSLHDVAEPQGILFLSGRDRIAVASGADGTCEVFDGDSLEKVATVALGDDADNVRFDPDRDRVIVGYGSGALGIVDPATWQVVARVPLAGHPESFQLEPGGKRAFVNVPGAHHVAVVDLDEHEVTTTWELDEAASNFPMAAVPAPDSQDRGARLLLGCRSPARLVIRALPSGEPGGTLDLSGDCDDVFHDAARRRVYAACGAGTVDVFDDTADGFRPRERVATARGARTCLFVPERSQLYVAVPHRGSQRAEIRIFGARD